MVVLFNGVSTRLNGGGLFLWSGFVVSVVSSG